MYVTVEGETSDFRVLLISKEHPAITLYKLNIDKEFDNTHFV